jgi:hypothetical protein
MIFPAINLHLVKGFSMAMLNNSYGFNGWRAGLQGWEKYGSSMFLMGFTM